ncbi:bifunctional methylenetetrahydrofolate dehydrogenase/methenyltetrahydrofolate cyclohydrolase FolD [Halopseudomonas salegens]|uniref:Bifunctional protein FolD n=1 Tax=Halopseudomonas salegens TaxID=1434072 RepID=A0A1H2HFX1_9GAMM|nr:bifunctional methylenetetrahydrofolate dehydrogenase/methenyltetrahydrofolate cyclohydrolase FolD [Halopseudomonas salegens]SDU30662.1 methenyltetrahydrofolate cyclohydrolase /5,10-methylenetetrahydrofolate dehydrogenase (NADP+) [Halopseudomonas salegens]
MAELADPQVSARLLDGRALAAQTRNALAATIRQRQADGLPPPGLAVILVGNDPASQVYVQHKIRACAEVGVHSFSHRLPADTDEAALLALIQTLNADPAVHGILLQLPLPAGLDSSRLLQAIAPYKDVDGFHPHNLGLLAAGLPVLRPCTPKGCMRLLESAGVDCRGQQALVIGASTIVGRPMALELLRAEATVTIAHKATRDLPALVAQADILVVATGVPGLVRGEWLKPGAVVLDVGINRLADGRLVGDVDFASARQRASWVSPVPGGVGPMTIACLLENTLQAATLVMEPPSGAAIHH